MLIALIRRMVNRSRGNADEEKLRRQIEELTPSNGDLHQLAERHPSPPEWLNNDEDDPQT